MVKVRGPLFSSQASGSIGNGTIQYRTTRNGPQAVIPSAGKPKANPVPTPNQAERRAEFKAIAADWARLEADTKAYWSQIASARALANGWTAYLAYRLAESFDPARALTLPNGEPITDGHGRRLFI